MPPQRRGHRIIWKTGKKGEEAGTLQPVFPEMNCTPDNGVINEGQLPLAGKNEGTLSLQQCYWLASRVNYGFCVVMGEAADIRERLKNS